MLPNLIIIGAMKGGTTSLYHYLASHPEVEPSAIKETDYFKSEETFGRGSAWYESLFRQPRPFAFEASISYTQRHLYPGVPQRIHALVPRARLVYVLRDPIERILSHYVHNRITGLESRTLPEALNTPGTNYILTSRYHHQIEAYLDLFPREQLLLVESEHLREDPAAVVTELFEAIGLSPDYDADVLRRRFHTSSAKRRPSPLERNLTAKTDNRYLLAAIRLATRPLRARVERPTLTAADRERLVASLAPDVAKLRAFSGTPFSRWSL